MYVIVHTRGGDAARDLLTEQPSRSDSRRIRDILLELGLKAEPLHPGATEPELACQLFVRVPTEQMATEVGRRLTNAGVVEAAYAKPPDSAP